MRKMSIAIVVESFHAQSGVDRRTSELVKGLLSAGHEVHIYANRWDTNAAEGIIFHRIPILKLGRALKSLSFAWFCSALIPKSQHDLIHTQARIFRYDVATLGVGCHWAYIDAMGINPKKTPDKWFHRAVLRIEHSMFALKRFTEGARIIVNSNKCRYELISYYKVPAGSIDVVHNGVDQEAFSPAMRTDLWADARRDLGISPKDIVVLFVGTGFHRKGLNTLIDAIGRVQLRSSPMADRLKLLIVGKGSKDEYNRLAAGMGIGERLIWVGQSDPNDIARYYAASDIFVLPTRYDPFANSTMEALACGLPVITTTTNGVSEIIRDEISGLIVEPNDAEGLSEKLQALAEDADFRQRIGSNGRKAVKPYTWQMATERTMTVYEDIIARRGGP